MRLYINDVAVRDGFQIEKDFVPTATKVELINQLSRTGLHKIEVDVVRLAQGGAGARRRRTRCSPASSASPASIYVALVPERPRRAERGRHARRSPTRSMA